MPLADWISDADYEWRTRLKRINLVVEAGFTADEIRTAQKQYGAASQHLFHQGWTHDEIIKKYPALTLVILVGHAALAYDQGRYWESFWEELDLSHGIDFENAIRRNVTGLLDKFSLARFPDIEQDYTKKYVMLLAMHAGIPIHCLADLLEIIQRHIVDGRDATGAALMAWLDEPGKKYRAAALDVPVRNFLMYGAEFAIDILDRIIEFVEATAADPALLDLELDSSNTGLPVVLLNELIQQLREKPQRWEPRGSSAAATAARPTIAYSTDDDEIIVNLPYPTVNPEVPWRVSFDGRVSDVRARRAWGINTQPPPTPVPIPGPVREVVLSHGPTAVRVTLPIVIKSDPLLIFSATGTWVPRRDGLKDAVWAAYPADHELVDPLTGNPVAITDAGSPTGWHGWRTVYIDLDAVGALQLRHNGQLLGTPKPVRKDGRPKIELGEPIPGVLSAAGHQVYGARPSVMLPPSALDSSRSWRLRVRRHGTTEWIVDKGWDTQEVETCIDPFDEAETSQLGLFDIVVTGPLGADARVVVFIAEGLWAEFDTAVRLPAARGLTACTAEIGADILDVNPDGTIDFGGTDVETTIGATNGEVTEELVLRPPHVQLRSGEVGTMAPWRITPDSWAPEELQQNRFVAVRVPGIDDVEFAFSTAGDELVHVESQPRRKQGDIFECDVRRFADTAGVHNDGRIVATWRTDTGAATVTVIAVHPQRLASGAELQDRRLQFYDLLDVDDLAAYVWSATAPWRPPQLLPLSDGHVQLPKTLKKAGELRCQLFVDDPWVSHDPPAKPAEDAFRISQPGWYRAGSDAQAKLSRFIAGEGPLPAGIGAAPEIWTALSWLHFDRENDHALGTSAALIKLLAEEPRKALEGLGNSTIALADRMAVLIRTELVNRSYASPETLHELHADPWFGCMVELADLGSLFHRRNKVAAERLETIGYLADRGGELLIEILRLGKTAALHEGCFGPNIFRLSAMPADQVTAIMAELKLVPGPLLHRDTRISATFEAFCQRGQWMAAGWSESFAAQTSFVIEPIRRASKLCSEAIEIRNDRLNGVDTAAHPWMLMSLQSLTLALLARLEAHGRVGGQYLNSGLLMAWSRLARLCPNMVAADLLIAEALVTYDSHGDLIKGTE